tara:strand:- start:1172 stop:1984 length:813 start_codon:yes stop_codon:yes gene_type:complete
MACASEPVPSTTPLPQTLPATEDTAPAVLEASPRHGEWVAVELPGSDMPVKTWVVYPERSGKAPIVLVIHEIYGLTEWVRAVADQFAAEGFIAVAPDLLSGRGPNGGGTDAFGSRDEAVKAILALEHNERTRRLDAVRAYALDIPAGSGRIGSVGFCWGGMASFAYAVDQPDLHAAVVYYGTSPADATDFDRIKAPVLGLYGEDDERVNATISPAENAMAALGQSYESVIFPGAGHGFLRAQAEREGANLRAAEQGWMHTLTFFREHLEH